jgi:FAD dependent monooxygenase
MFADYYCAFGVSNFITDDPAIIPGDGQITYDEKVSSVVVSSTRNRSFWFLIIKFDDRKKYPNIPRFTTEEAEREVTKYLDKQITEKTKMRDLWDTRIKCSMAALEEVVFETWFEDRVVLLGDAAHKACHFRTVGCDWYNG